MKCLLTEEKIKMMWCMLSHFSHVQLFVTLWTVGHQAPRSMGFSRKEYWRGLPCPPPGDLPNPGIEPASLKSPELAGRLFTTSAIWEACVCVCVCVCVYIYMEYIYNGILLSHSVQFSHSVTSNSLQPHGLQHKRMKYCYLQPPGWT